MISKLLSHHYFKGYDLYAYMFSCPSAYNPGQSIWNKIEKSSKTGQDKKSLISTFTCFWTAITKFIFWRRDWALGSVSTQISDFSSISLFPKILNLFFFSCGQSPPAAKMAWGIILILILMIRNLKSCGN